MANYVLHNAQTVAIGSGQGAYLNSGASGAVVTVAKQVLALNYTLVVPTLSSPTLVDRGRLYVNVFTTPYTITAGSVIAQAGTFRRFKIEIPPVAGTYVGSFDAFIACGEKVWAWVDYAELGIALTLSTTVSECNA